MFCGTCQCGKSHMADLRAQCQEERLQGSNETGAFHEGCGVEDSTGIEGPGAQQRGLNTGKGRCSIDRMEKKGQGASSAGKRGSSATKTVDEYLESVAAPAHGMMIALRGLIRSVLPLEATETISYRMPAFKHRKVLVWFAAFKNHCSLFPGAGVIEQFKEELKGFKVSKGTVQFPTDKPLPAALIRRLVKARLKQSEGE